MLSGEVLSCVLGSRDVRPSGSSQTSARFQTKITLLLSRREREGKRLELGAVQLNVSFSRAELEEI